MDIRVRVARGSDFREREDKIVELSFDDFDDAQEFTQMAIAQGYVVKMGIGNLDE